MAHADLDCAISDVLPHIGDESPRLAKEVFRLTAAAQDVCRAYPRSDAFFVAVARLGNLLDELDIP